MTKTLLIVNRSLVGAGTDPRDTRWQLSRNQYRGHPMVSRRGGSTVDYFRRCMARYYGWKVGGHPGTYSDFGYLATGDTLLLPAQASTEYNVAFNIENGALLLNQVLKANDADTNTTIGDIIDAIESGAGAFAMASLFGYPTRNTTNALNPFSNSSFSQEYVFLQLEAGVGAWQTVSNTKGISNFAEHLTSESPNTDTDPWYNWQAYVLGDGALDFDGSARKFPGIYGAGMQGKFFSDHAFERDLPGIVGTSMAYNYSNSFFDNIGSNPYVSELLVPNFYIVGSVMADGEGAAAYPNLFSKCDSTNSMQAWYHGMWDRNNVKDILALILGPTTGGTAEFPATDIVASTAQGTGIPPAQVAAANQAPNSLLNRFTRRNFSDQDPDVIAELDEARNINRHIGIPHRMLSGGSDSIVKDMNGNASKYPYAVVVDLSAFSGSTTDFIDSMDRVPPAFDAAETLSEVTSNFFLYEVMKANILNFSNATGSALSLGSISPYYENLDSSAMLTETPSRGGPGMDLTEGTEKKYYGFSSTSTSPPWAQGPEALQPYSLRAIDLRNMFRSLFKYSMDIINTPEGPDVYTGLAGQTLSERIAMGKGIVVGTRTTVEALTAGAIIQNLPRNGLDGDNLADFFIQMSDFMNENTRNFANMVSGDKAYRNTLVYKLDKHAVTSGGQPSAEPIQSIYFAAVEGLHKYTDTQVLFGKKYIYKLYAYDLVLGNDYKYQSAQVFPPIEDYYPNPFIRQLSDVQPSLLGPATTGQNWSLTGDGVYIGTPIQREALMDEGGVGLLSWPNGRIMPQIDLSDGVDLLEAIGAVAFPSYADIKFNGTYLEAPLPLLNVVLKPGNWAAYESVYVQGIEDAINGMIDTYFDENTQLSDTQRYLSKVRVRSISPYVVSPQSLVNQSTETQILIAQVGTLVVDGGDSAPQQAIVERIRSISGTNAASIFPASVNPFASQVGSQSLFEAYFDLTTATDLGDVANFSAGSPLELSLLFHTGQHGIEPRIPWNLDDAGTATAIVKNYKSPKIIEIPIGQTNPIVVTDLPPQFPDVDIFPLKGSNREIKILLNSNFTKAAYVPIIIEPTDTGLFADVLDAQGKQVGEPVLFRSDDTAAAYQVFRTTDKPNSYQDFAGKLHLTKEATTPNNMAVEATSFLDKVDPNMYYYYCFRAIDSNGYVSNPTAVLRVQMVDDNGRIYPIIEPHVFDLSDPRKTEKSFKRYIEIDTSLQESMITFPTADSAGDPYTAPTGVSVGSPGGVYDSQTTYKVRIISKDTGRKIDLNLNFNIETIPNPKLPGN